MGRGEGTQAVLSEVMLGSAFFTGEHTHRSGVGCVGPHNNLGGVLFLSPFQK